MPHELPRVVPSNIEPVFGFHCAAFQCVIDECFVDVVFADCIYGYCTQHKERTV